MKTMGLTQLYLVEPREYPHATALSFASGADDTLAGAVVCDSLDQALDGTVMAVAVTARNRDLSHEVVCCREACARLAAQAAHADVAVVFGTERTGLTIAEVSKCGLIATIPANPAYSSLNLAQAVQVFAYELRMAVQGDNAMPAVAASNLATHEDVERFYAHLEAVMHETRFLDPAQPGRLMQRMRRLFARARLEKEELNILRGLLNAVRGKH